VAGQARLDYGDNVHKLSVNESTYHGAEVADALENPGELTLGRF
jgi:hypothetical protein